MAFKMKYGQNLPFDYGNGSHLKQVAPTYKKNKDGEDVEITKNGGKKKAEKYPSIDEANNETTPTKNQGEDPVEPLSTRIANNELTQEEKDAIRLAEIKIIRERLNKGK